MPAEEEFPMSNVKCQMSNVKNIQRIRYWILDIGYLKLNNGFTLIEFLVVLGILTVAVGSSLLFLTSTLKGSNQAHISAEVKQNGQAVLDTLENQIRNARDVSALDSSTIPQIPSGASSAIHLTLSDGSSLFLACAEGSSSSNGWIGSSATGDVITTFTPLTSKDPKSGVNISSCSFSVTSADGTSQPPLVHISFDASQGVVAPSRQDFSSTIHFGTTLSLRNYEF